MHDSADIIIVAHSVVPSSPQPLCSLTLRSCVLHLPALHLTFFGNDKGRKEVIGCSSASMHEPDGRFVSSPKNSAQGDGFQPALLSHPTNTSPNNPSSKRPRVFPNHLQSQTTTPPQRLRNLSPPIASIDSGLPMHLSDVDNAQRIA